MAINSRSRTFKSLRNILNDALYRGSLHLLANTIMTSAIGFAFWTLAAHRYSASTVGMFSGIISGASLLAAIAALGLPITMTRHIASAEHPGELVLGAVTIISTAGTILCLVTVISLGPHLPTVLHIQQRGGMVLLVTVLVIFTAVGGTLNAGLVAIRSTRILLIKNLLGSIVKLIAMLLLTAFRSSGLLISFGLGLVLATVLSGAALGWRIRGKRVGSRPFCAPWRYLSITSGNYLATVIGIMPLAIVPIEVLAVRGATETARFSIAFLIAGFLNFIPSTMGQVLFAEIARGGVPLGQQFHKALRGVYGLLLPSMILLLILAPFVLRLFGQAYATEATSCLRVLALSALPAGGTYLVDSLLIARDRTATYTFMQIANAALVLGSVAILLPRGLTAAAIGWTLAQALTLVLGLLVLATGRNGRHHPKVGAAPAATELRSAYSHPHQHMSRSRSKAGHTAQCGLWFPPIKIPVGFGQTRSASQLPVLIMITDYSRWLSAVLVPSRHPEDLFAGWWELIADLGAVPHMLTSHNVEAIGSRKNGGAQIAAQCEEFCRSLNTSIVMCKTNDPATTDLVERAQAYLERSFLSGRTFNSPRDFNIQLRDWLLIDNTRRHEQPSYAPAVLITADRNAMLPLPQTPPATGWRLPMRVGDRPFIHFDSNEYSVHPTLIGSRVELVADLRHVRILCDGKVAAWHNRAWAHERTIRDPIYGTAPRTSPLNL